VRLQWYLCGDRHGQALHQLSLLYQQPSDVLHLRFQELRFALLMQQHVLHVRSQELHFALLMQQHGGHVQHWLARVEPLLPGPQNTTPCQTSTAPHLILLSIETQLNQFSEMALLNESRV